MIDGSTDIANASRFIKQKEIDLAMKNNVFPVAPAWLGLSIVKHIIQGHGGSVWVRSELEEGSSFTFSLPKKQYPH